MNTSLKPRWYQFSTRKLLVWVAAIALVFGIDSLRIWYVVNVWNEQRVEDALAKLPPLLDNGLGDGRVRARPHITRYVLGCRIEMSEYDEVRFRFPNDPDPQKPSVEFFMFPYPWSQEPLRGYGQYDWNYHKWIRGGKW